MNFVCFVNNPSKQQHFNLTKGNLVYCFSGKLICLDKILPNSGFLTLYFLACVASVSVEQRAKNGVFSALPAQKMGQEQK